MRRGYHHTGCRYQNRRRRQNDGCKREGFAGDTSRAALQEKALGGEYPFTIATWNLRLAMEKEFPDEEWRSADLRKILMELAKDGTVSKDTHASRIGQAVWRLEVR